MFSIAYAFKGQVQVFAGRVKIVSHSSCRTVAILKYFCPLHVNSKFACILVENKRVLCLYTILKPKKILYVNVIAFFRFSLDFGQFKLKKKQGTGHNNRN